MPFDDQSTYIKHQSDCDCEDNCSCQSEDCGCCSPVLVAHKYCDGDISCVTPNDSAQLDVHSHIPAVGYVKLFNPTNGEYLGDVTPTEALTFIAALDDNVDPPSQGDEYNITTTDSVALSAPADTETDSANVAFSVDRISCDQNIAVSLAGAPSGVTFLGGAVSINIPAATSYITDGIRITDEIDPGNYNITVLYDGCTNQKTKTLILNVT